MKSKFVFACLAVLVANACVWAQPAPAPGDGPLVSVAWLSAHIKDPKLVLLYVGPKPEFDKEHIAGSQFITQADVAAPPPDMNHMDALSLELPPIEQLKATLEKRGISNDSRIVVYCIEGWIPPSTRIVWTLNYAGLGDRTSLLDGGIAAWKAAGNPVTAEVVTPAPGHFTPQVNRDVFADASYVLGHLRQPSVAIIDGRFARDYNGLSGHVPGAANLPIEKISSLSDRAALQQLLREAGVKQGSEVVSYCYIGQRATLIWFAARLLGYQARMYDGAWDEWSRRADLPVEVDPAQKKRIVN